MSSIYCSKVQPFKSSKCAGNNANQSIKYSPARNAKPGGVGMGVVKI